MEGDTIAAISTAVGNAGIGIVRVSGPDAFSVADGVYVSPGGKKRLSAQQTHTIHYGFICDGGQTIDEVLVMLMRAPRSYTTEDTVEINCHGGILAARKVLSAVIRHGARPAEPGEFTKRAFLNGRIDLSQAESVMDVIQSKSERALKNSVLQLQGAVSQKLKSLRERILYQTAAIESALDDPEHYSLEGFSEKLRKEISSILEELNRLIASAEDGRLLKEGIRTVILGKPNAGKSSLLNLLSGEESAIVTDIAGTTRDTLEETVSLKGITFHLVDTAGIRNSEEYIEQLGIARAKEKAKTADLILYVADSSVPLDENDREILPYLSGKRTVVLLNKADLPPVSDAAALQEFTGGRFPVLPVSARDGKGLDRLKELLEQMFFRGELEGNEEIYITSARQKAALCSAAKSLDRVLESISLGMPEDFFTVDLMSAYGDLGSILGEEVGEDLIDEIFGRFCMGK